MGFPKNAIQFCLSHTAAHPKDIDKVVMVTRDIDPLVLFINRSTEFSVQEHVRQQYEYYLELKMGHNESKVRNQYAHSCSSFKKPNIYDFSNFGELTSQKEDSERFFLFKEKNFKKSSWHPRGTDSSSRPSFLSRSLCLWRFSL